MEDNEIITDDKRNAELFNEYFVNITQNLDIPKFAIQMLPADVICIDPIDEIIYNYSKHPSILKILETVETSEKFYFNRVNNTQIERGILELNTKKSAGHDNIPSKVIKDSLTVITPPLTNLFNNSVAENLFPTDLKYANVAPLHKKDDNTRKENYRPISI